MANIFEHLKELFLPSNKINAKDFHFVKNKIIQWRKNNIYPENYELPFAVKFPSQFWERVKAIYRYTYNDGHERAINVWWADGDIIVTDSLRGTTDRVNIPKQKISVRYIPISPTSSNADKIVEVNGKVYLKKTVSLASLKNKKSIEVQFLFNMHTHPFHELLPGKREYSFFSDTDIRSFLSGGSVITGLVTDELWLLMRTKDTPSSLNEADGFRITLEYLRDVMNLRVYRGNFGKAVISQTKQGESKN